MVALGLNRWFYQVCKVCIGSTKVHYLLMGIIFWLPSLLKIISSLKEGFISVYSWKETLLKVNTRSQYSEDVVE